MPDIFEEVVSNWLFSKGYFVITNLKVGNNEIDLLAIRITKGKKDARRMNPVISSAYRKNILNSLVNKYDFVPLKP